MAQLAGQTLALDATVNGVARRFAVRLPADYDAYTPSPVVVVWHGAQYPAPSATFVEFSDDGQFGPVVADTQNVVMIAPLGLDQGDTGKHGNSGYGWDLQANGNDMQLMVYTLAWAKTNLCVDSSKVYTMGFSWGAEMAHVVACYRPDLVSAAQADSGTFDYTAAGCASSLPALRMTFDAEGDPYYTIGDLMSTVQGYAALQGCSTVADSSTDSVMGQTCKTYTDCTSGKEVTYCPVTGLGHAIPTGDAWTTWAFFQRASQ